MGLAKAGTINEMVLTKLWHLTSLQILSKQFLNKIEMLLNKQLWGKTERLQRTTVMLPYTQGGLGLTHAESKAQALMVKHIPHIFTRPRATWIPKALYWVAITLRKQLSSTNYQIHNKTMYVNAFYKQAMQQYNMYHANPRAVAISSNPIRQTYDLFVAEIAIPLIVLLEGLSDRYRLWKNSGVPICHQKLGILCDS